MTTNHTANHDEPQQGQANNTNRDRRSVLGENLLTILTIIGVVGGTIFGLILKKSDHNWTQRDIMYIQYPGDLFLRMLKCLIVPLLVASITSAIGGLDLSLSKKIALRSIVYYFTTTVCAVILGIILVTVFQPGKGHKMDDKEDEKVSRDVLTADTLLDLVRNLFPPNIVQATMFQYRTHLEPPENVTAEMGNGTKIKISELSPDERNKFTFSKFNFTDFDGREVPLTSFKIKGQWREGMNVLGLVMFSVVLGATIGKMRERGKPIQDFLVSLSEAMMIITRWVIWISPIGVFFLIAAKILEMESLAEVIGKLGKYFITVMFGLFVHGLGTIAIIFYIVVRKLPYGYIVKMSQVLATAFGTGSSSATMPITINCLDNMGIDPRVTRFVVPVGATINMDGTALYEAVAALFIAQLRNKALTLGKIVAVSVTATAASIGAAGIPQAGLITMVMVLDTVGLPAEDVTIIIAVDWLLDRFRTTINVMCDALGTILVDHLSKGELSGTATKLELGEPHELVELHQSKD
ncbi:excitatory amino acid transporter 3 isoform X1 [Chironomus tepperi]|uniref:excitatory amino acid transporter 3 isoform X1 n=1 Tax=Chironomus tepperi TaxID=113505 RepID=UPI00391FC925